MAEKRVIELEIQDNSKSLKSQYKEAVAELQKVSAQYGETSQQAINAAKAAAQLKDQIGFSKDLVDSFNPDAKFNALSKSIGGVLDGFQAFEGALGLIGVESEAVQETMLKVQSAMALSQGIQGVFEAKDAFIQLGSVLKTTAIGQALLTAATAAYNFVVGASTTALKVFRIALISTGIGALVVGLGLLIANWDKVTEAVRGVIKWFDKLGPVAKTVVTLLFPIIAVVKGIISALEFFGVVDDEQTAKMRANSIAKTQATEKEMNKKIAAEKKKAQAVDDALSFEIRKAQAAGKNTEQMEEKKLKAAIKSGRAILQMQKEKIAAYEDEIRFLNLIGEADSDRAKQLQKTLSETKKNANEQYKVNKKNVEDLTVLQITADKERTDKAVAAAKERKDKIKQIRDSELEQIKENNRLALAENEARLKTDQQNEEFAVTEKYKSQIALAKKYGKDTTQLELAQANEINEIRLKYQQEELDAIKEANRLKIEAEQELQAQIEEIDEANFQARLQKTMSEDEYALELVRQKYFALEEAAKGNAEQLAIIEEAKSLEIEAIDKKSKEKQIAAENELRQKRLQLAGQAFTAIGDIIGSFTAKNDKDARKQFQIQKAFNLAAAVTNTAMAVTGALTAGGNPIKLATGAQFVEAGIAAAVGAANIIKIASSKFGGGASGGGSAPTGSGGGGAVMTPNFNVIGSSGVNQLAQIQQQPTRAYVVSGDVANGLSLERNRLQNATL